MFSDNFLPYVDEITICLLGSNIQNELYIIPVSTAQSTYESIIKIEKLDELDVQKINFEIRYSDQINRNRNTKNIVVFWKNKVHYCKREKISSFLLFIHWSKRSRTVKNFNRRVYVFI